MTTTTDEQPFGFTLRRPGPRSEDGYERTAVYSAPTFATPRYEWRSRTEASDAWSLSLPHSCDKWEIADGSREDVLAAAKRFRAELDAAIAVMEAAA